jgi:hypothetical protein
MEESKTLLFHSLTSQVHSASDSSPDSELDTSLDLLIEMESKQIDELLISSKDKEFMKLWNKHISLFALSSSYMLKSCLDFINKNRKTLSGLSQEWSWHLLALRGYNIITDDDILLLLLALKQRD